MTTICLFFIFILCVGLNGDYIDVAIDQGTVRGYKHPTLALYTFYGIPYATVPSGRDKFKAPGPAPRWEDTFNAVDNFIFCPQYILPDIREDCLVVNVYVPHNNISSQPVLVYVHGGGFNLGWGTLDVPLTVVEKNVVVVSFNYRLGAHGFLCLNTENVPGNAGLRDQIAALEWIKDNIKAFSGDPDDVTIFGSSAGAASVELLMLSPAARNLFSKVISDGGSGMTTWAVNPHGVEYARTVATLNGAVNVDNITELENFYLNKTYAELISLQQPGLHVIQFAPCVEYGNVNTNPVLSATPKEILVSGNYTKLPLLTGYSTAEGLLYYMMWREVMLQMNTDFSELLPPNFSFHTMNATKAAQSLKLFYFDENYINYDSMRNYTDYFTDSYFSYWIIESAKLHALHTSVYLYEFTYVPSTQSIRPDLGAAHCIPTNLVTNYAAVGLNDDDLTVQNRLVNMWTNFIKIGQPVPQGESYYWEPLNVDRINYLEIGLTVQNKSHPLLERMQLWERVVNMESDDGTSPDSAISIKACLTLLLLNIVIMIM